MADARKRKFDSILVTRFDRFARSTKHSLTCAGGVPVARCPVRQLPRKHRHEQRLGQALFTIVSAVAQLERDLIRERVSAGVRNARASVRNLAVPVEL
jgi:DNA invertase Pin-like site-specific DNA recombinase